MKKSFFSSPIFSNRIWFYFSLLLSLGFLLLIFSEMTSTSMLRMYFNSDMLYDPVIFRDIFIDKSGFKGWHLNAAPNFFPDMLFYFICNAISGNFISANFLFSIGQYFSILLLVFWIFFQVNREKAWQYSTLFNYLLFLFLLIPIFTSRTNLSFQLISISYHIGSFIMFLLCLNMFILYLKKMKLWQLGLLFLCVLIGAFNDRLFITQFVFATVPLAVLLYNKHIRFKLLKPLLAIIIATIIGQFLFKSLVQYEAVHIIDTGFKMYNFENLKVSWNTFWSYLASVFHHDGFERIIILLCLISLLFSIIFAYRNRLSILTPKDKESFKFEKYVLLIILIYIPVTLLTPVLNGAFVGPSIIRFNIMAFFMGLMLLPMVLLLWPEIEKSTSKILRYLLPLSTLFFILLFSIKISSSEFRQGIIEYFTFYPERVELLDELKEEHDLKYGIGNYWHAKYATMFSKNDIRLYTVFGHTMRPFYHSTNENWYHSGGKGKYKDPVFNYTLRLKETDSQKLIEVFGNKLDTIYSNSKDNYVIIKLPEFQIDKESREIILMDSIE